MQYTCLFAFEFLIFVVVCLVQRKSTCYQLQWRQRLQCFVAFATSLRQEVCCCRRFRVCRCARLTAGWKHTHAQTFDKWFVDNHQSLLGVGQQLCRSFEQHARLCTHVNNYCYYYFLNRPRLSVADMPTNSYALNIKEFSVGFKQGLQVAVDDLGIKAVFMGQRATDPHCGLFRSGFL